MNKQSMSTTGIALERATDRTPEPTQGYRLQHDPRMVSCATRRKAEQADHAAIAARGDQPWVVETPDQAGVRAVRRRHDGRTRERERRLRHMNCRLGSTRWGDVL